MKIFCSGIGGIGLSAYAALQQHAGHDVFGSDRSDSTLLDDLRQQGIQISLNQDGSAIPTGCDLFVHSEAIPTDAPERKLAKERGIRSITYFEGLGELSQGYRVIAVCGTHGKSSTTAMAARVLVDAGLDPTIVVGTKVPDLGGKNWRKGESNLFLLEACEYRRDFRFIDPSIVLMLNVDGDHFDAFSSVADYQHAFVEFLRRLPEDGLVITHGGDADCLRVAREADRPMDDADELPVPALAVPGEHMRQNARLVMALARELDIPDDAALASLQAFRGTWRRMEIKGEGPKESLIVDDYAHHPKEIRASLSGLREAYPSKRMICVFQPHTHERTRTFYKEFLEAFGDADIVVIPDIFNARSDIETEMVDVTTFIADLAAASGKRVENGQGMEATEKLLRDSLIEPGDLVVCMGAGTITKLADNLVRTNP